MRSFFGIGWIILILTLAGIAAGCGSSGHTSPGPAPTSTDEKITVSLGQEFRLGVGQQATFSDAPLDIIFHRVTGDSRCPRDATCIWQGEASAEIEIIDWKGDPATIWSSQVIASGDLGAYGNIIEALK